MSTSGAGGSCETEPLPKLKRRREVFSSIWGATAASHCINIDARSANARAKRADVMEAMVRQIVLDTIGVVRIELV